MGDQAALALRIRHEDTQTAGNDQEKSGIIFALAVQQHAARQREPVGFREQGAESAFADILQQRKAFQPLQQFFGIDGLLADAEGGQERHALLLPPHAVQPPSTFRAAPVM